MLSFQIVSIAATAMLILSAMSLAVPFLMSMLMVCRKTCFMPAMLRIFLYD